MENASLLEPQAPAPLPLRLLGRLVDWVVIGIGATMATMVLLNVCLHVLHKDLAWVTEFGELLLVWVTFLGGACAVQRGSHMSITEFIDKLDSSKRRWADAVVQAICLGMLVVLTQYGWNLVDANWGNRLTVLGWPMAIQYMGMAMGSSLMLVFMAWDLWQILTGIPRNQRYQTSE